MLCHCNPCVHVFSHAGEKLRSLISVSDPWFFCLDAADNIIISKCSAHRIEIVFSKEGNLIKTLSGEGQPGMLHYPRVCLFLFFFTGPGSK